MTVLSSKQIVKLISEPATGASLGSVAYMARRGRPGSSVVGGPSAKQQAFLADMGKVRPAQRETYQHPADAPPVLRQEGPVSPVEVAWLNRLPQDPQQVSFDDARALATMARTVLAAKHPADARLVHQVWDPIKAVHDQAAAKVAIDNDRQPLPDVPSSTLGALADAIHAEQDQLRPEEALTRASVMLQQARQQRVAAHEQTIASATEQHDIATAAAAQRLAATR